MELFKPCLRCWEKQNNKESVWALNNEVCDICMGEIREENNNWLMKRLSLDSYCLHWTTKSLIDLQKKLRKKREGKKIIKKWKKWRKKKKN